MSQVSLNNEQRLFVLKHEGGGYTCLGFDVCEQRRQALAKELKQEPSNAEKGTIEAYKDYQRLIGEAQKRYEASGWKSKSELQKPLIGKEGRKIAAVDKEGHLHIFKVGISTGFIPCHLEVEEGERGGGALYLDRYTEWQFIN